MSMFIIGIALYFVVPLGLIFNKKPLDTKKIRNICIGNAAVCCFISWCIADGIYMSIPLAVLLGYITYRLLKYCDEQVRIN